MYARIENGILVEWPIINLRQRLPQVSFAEEINNDNLPDGFVFISPSVVPTYDTETQSIVLDDPSLVNGIWTQEYSVVPLSEEQLQHRYTNIVEQMRHQRDELLLNSDWSQLPDSPVDKAAWATYRQALRDVTLQPGFPYDISWPNVVTS
jgi:hypothetical protein